MSMKELEGTELVLRITGSVEQSNLKEFETQALEVIAGINTKLETDQDFADADVNIKGCQTMEARISTARSTALANTAAIAELIKTTERLEEKFRETRLSLSKLVVKEKDRRKAEVMTAVRDRLSDRLINSPVRHGFIANHTAITDAAKNRRSLKNLEEAVNEVIDAEILRLAGMEVSFAANLAKIEEADAQWPGLFHDKQNMALSAPETVDAVVAGRIADHRLRVAEKARKEQEEKERKERIEAELKAAAEAKEAERVAKELEEYVEAEAAKIDAENNPFAAEPEPVVTPPSPAEIPIPVPFHDFPIPPPITKEERYFLLSVSTETDNITPIIQAIKAIPGVQDAWVRS